MIEIRISGDSVSTHGAVAFLGHELRANLRDRSLGDAAGQVLQGIVQYFAGARRPLLPDETIPWSTWLLKAFQAEEHVFELLEVSARDPNVFVRGIDRAVKIWLDQRSVCDRQASKYLQTGYGDLIAVSPGVLTDTAKSIEGIRYSPSGKMSGWWVFHADYDGVPDGFKSIQPTHAGHLIERRPETARFLALASGYVFRIGPNGTERVWKEDAV